MQRYPNTFSSFTIGNKEVKNRLVSSGHGESLTNDGVINDQLIRYYERKAMGGVGMIIAFGSGTVYQKASHPKYVSLWNPLNEPFLKELAEKVRKHGTILLAQATHKGRRLTSKHTGYPIQAPSAVPEGISREIPAVLSIDDIKAIVSSYADAAARLERCGFDGIEITSYGGHLIEQFWSPTINQRTDKYGGSLDGRMRFSREVIEAVAEAVSDDFIISFRMTGDPQTNLIGLDKGDMVEIAKLLEKTNRIDLFNISGGTGATLELQAKTIPPDPIAKGCYNHLAKNMKEELSTPVLVAGRILTPSQAEASLVSNECDLVAMTRAIIADPYLPHHANKGNAERIRPCIGTNQGCIARTYEGFAIGCVVNPGIIDDSLHDLAPIAEKQKVVIIGGGPAGMETARVAKERGHEVILFEKSSQLGGQILIGKNQPNRDNYGFHIEWLKSELERLNVDVRLNTEATAETILDHSIDTLVIATGSKTVKPEEAFNINIPCVTDVQILNEERDIIKGSNIVIYDAGGKRGGYVANYIAEKGAAKIELFSPLETVCADLDLTNRPEMYKSLAKNNVICTPNKDLVGHREGALVLQDTWSKTKHEIINADLIVFAGFRVSINKLEDEIRSKKPNLNIEVIGDSYAPRTMSEAIAEGVQIGNKIGSKQRLEFIEEI